MHKGRMELVGWRSTHQREARRTGGEGGKQSCVAPVAMDEPMMGGWDPGVRWDQGVDGSGEGGPTEPREVEASPQQVAYVVAKKKKSVCGRKNVCRREKE